MKASILKGNVLGEKVLIIYLHDEAHCCLCYGICK